MEYEKIINLLDNAPNQPSKLRTRNWAKINDEAHGTCSTNSQIKFEALMLKSSLCDYSVACILVKSALSVANKSEAGAAPKQWR